MWPEDWSNGCYDVALFFNVRFGFLYQSCSLSALQARLKVAAHQAEEESEETAENFWKERLRLTILAASWKENGY